MKTRKKRPLLVPGFLIGTGILLMAYPFVSNSLYEHRQEEVIYEYQKETDKKDRRHHACQKGHSLSSSKKGDCPKGQPLNLFAYSMMLETTPEPTVLPPSRIANRNPSSIAICVIILIFICTLSPGMTISTPSGSLMTPVTSVVRK